MQPHQLRIEEFTLSSGTIKFFGIHDAVTVLSDFMVAAPDYICGYSKNANTENAGRAEMVVPNMAKIYIDVSHLELLDPIIKDLQKIALGQEPGSIVDEQRKNYIRYCLDHVLGPNVNLSKILTVNCVAEPEHAAVMKKQRPTKKKTTSSGSTR